MQPFSSSLGSCGQLSARNARQQLPAGLTFELAELLEGLVCCACFDLVHGLRHFSEHGCEVLIIVSMCRFVGCLAGCLGIGATQLALAVSLMEVQAFCGLDACLS